MNTREFRVSEGEFKVAQAWKDSHHCKISDELRNDSISFTPGSAFHWTFGETGIGYTVGVRCACGSKQDFTDYSLW